MRWLDFGARNRLSDKGCHPFYEFPYDSAKICSFSLFAKPVHINFKKLYQNGYFIFEISHFYMYWFIFSSVYRFLHSLRSVEMTWAHSIRMTTVSSRATVGSREI